MDVSTDRAAVQPKRIANEWRVATRLVAQMTVALGIILVVIGGSKSIYVFMESRRGLETLASIDSAARSGYGASGWVDLSWQDPSGATRQALGVEVTSDLGRKLRIGGSLMRSQLRIRYRPDSQHPMVLVLDDVPAQIKRASAISIAGFFAISAGSFIMLWLSMLPAAPHKEP